MKPVFQTIDNEINGNCLAACLASIFEDDINSYPSMSDLDLGETFWMDAINDHLKSKGYYIITTACDKPEYYIKGYHLVLGAHKNSNVGHCTVGLNGKVVHDPSKYKPILDNIHYGLLIKLII